MLVVHYSFSIKFIIRLSSFNEADFPVIYTLYFITTISSTIH